MDPSLPLGIAEKAICHLLSVTRRILDQHPAQATIELFYGLV
jgi:hypothetical protein